MGGGGAPGGLLPRARLRRSDAELSTLTAIPLTGSVGTTGIPYQFLSGLAADIDTLESDPTAEALGGRAADLIATLIPSRLGMPWASTTRMPWGVGLFTGCAAGDTGMALDVRVAD